MSTLKRLHSQARARRQGKPAFTLLELIVVLLVLGILAAIAVPTFNTVKENSVERAAQTTLEAAARNGEAIAASDRDASDEDIAEAVEDEFTDADGRTVTVSGDTVTVTHTSGSITASGSVEFNDGVATITNATAGSGGSSSTTSSTTSTTVASVSYAVGDTGPAGGVIFYVAATPFACGATLSATCTYLEAAPVGIDGFQSWCSDTSTLLVTATAIGTGMANTTTADATCESGAIQEAADYSRNGYTDWFLPSKDELAEMNAQQSVIGGLGTASYWSSSEFSADSAWFQVFGVGHPSNGLQDYIMKFFSYRAHPVRAF